MSETIKFLSHKDVEEKLGFTHYIETKSFEDYQEIEVEHDKLVDAFLKFNNGKNLRVILFTDSEFRKELDLSLKDIEKELRLLKNNKGLFCSPDDEELGTSVALITDDYMAEFMQEIIFFDGTEDVCDEFSKVLDEFTIEHFPPMPKNKMVFEEDITKYRKLGKNEPCWCGSEKKYKKCCMNKDIKETGKVKKVHYRDYDGLGD